MAVSEENTFEVHSDDPGTQIKKMMGWWNCHKKIPCGLLTMSKWQGKEFGGTGTLISEGRQ